MIKRIIGQIFLKGLPKWFRLLNGSLLLPILLWPFVLYTTIFFFDNPKNLGLTYLAFFAVNAYPIYLLTVAYFNSKLFQKNKILGSILPTTTLSFLTVGVVYILFSMGQVIYRSATRDIERAKQGYIGTNNDYRVLDNKVFRKDTLIVGADASTFEIISWDWQRDKNFYYRFGKKITEIDRQSFELLDYHYAKDKNHVFYDENIIEGADAPTFKHIDGTQDGKDKNFCYRYGEKVDCKILLIDEE